MPDSPSTHGWREGRKSDAKAGDAWRSVASEADAEAATATGREGERGREREREKRERDVRGREREREREVSHPWPSSKAAHS